MPNETAKETTERGFRIYARVPSRDGGTVQVQESSLAFEGAHVRLFLKGAECSEHMGRHHRPEPHLSVAGARALRDALATFITEAEEDELTETAEVAP
jgi:hypothetical protein